MEQEEKVTIFGEENRRSEIMNRVIMSLVYIVMAAGCFGCGYWIGTAAVPDGEIGVIDEAVVNTDTEVMAEIWYEVSVTGNRLCLYRVNEIERVLLASEEISAEVFPYDDRTELDLGLVFESFEAAQASFEDFVS